MASILPSISILCVVIAHLSFLTDGGGVGVNYGLNGDNLPPPFQVLDLLEFKNIKQIRIFSPDVKVLKALQNKGIELIIGTLDEDISNLATNVKFAKKWVHKKILPFANTIKIRCISIGNEVIPGGILTNQVYPAIQNMNTALEFFSLGYIPVTTTITLNSLTTSPFDPPSFGDFKGDVKPAMTQIAGFLGNKGYPLLVTAYPYFAYASAPTGSIPLPYVLFTSSDVIVTDGNLGYTNMFDAMVDSVYSALEKINAGGVEVVVAETGWPSEGNGNITTTQLAQTYNQNLVNHVRASGTPKRPDKRVETYVFSLFNENQRWPGVQQHFGLCYPNMVEVYHVDF